MTTLENMTAIHGSQAQSDGLFRVDVLFHGQSYSHAPFFLVEYSELPGGLVSATLFDPACTISEEFTGSRSEAQAWAVLESRTLAALDWDAFGDSSEL